MGGSIDTHLAAVIASAAALTWALFRANFALLLPPKGPGQVYA